MDYKGVKYSVYPEWSAVASVAYHDSASSDIEYILHVNAFTELIGFIKPENVIVDHRLASRPSQLHLDFYESRIFKDMFDYGVKRIFFILTEEELAYAQERKSERLANVYACASIDEIFNILEKKGRTTFN
ncbi:MAG TPA: hypothetical protein VD794_05205 [Flavisolibacter sp.]|nr:hypothetical protein [Flavisolibacter sp.]